MTLSEFRNEFDVLFNNVTSNQAPGLDSYEISVFLTKAEHQLIDEYFNIRVDGTGGGFDGTQKRQYDFSSIIKTVNLFDINTFEERIPTSEKLHKKSNIYLLPKDFYLTVNEIISDSKYQYAVLPIKYSEYHRLMCKPYNYPPKKSAWRIITDRIDCNYCHDLNTDYTFISSWPSGGRSLNVTLKSNFSINRASQVRGTIDSEVSEMENITELDTDFSKEDISRINVDSKNIYFKSSKDLFGQWYRLYCTTSLDSNSCSVDIILSGYSDELPNDKTFLELVQEGFNLLKDYLDKHPEYKSSDWDIIKAMRMTDGFALAEIPNSETNFTRSSGYTFITKPLSMSLIEVIGKFNDSPKYLMRYVRTLKPIILEDLDTAYGDLSIEGEQKACDCELPEETHHEILERAVALAKITWAGSTVTQAKNKE